MLLKGKSYNKDILSKYKQEKHNDGENVKCGYNYSSWPYCIIHCTTFLSYLDPECFFN